MKLYGFTVFLLVTACLILKQIPVGEINGVHIALAVVFSACILFSVLSLGAYVLHHTLGAEKDRPEKVRSAAVVAIGAKNRKRRSRAA